MEYVVVRSSHPTWLTTQLPADAVGLLKFRPPSAHSVSDGTGAISFLSRGAGIARVVASHLSRETLAFESVRGRLLATSRPGARHLFSLPTALLAYLGVEVSVRGPREGKSTDDQLLWFVPAEEYYSFRRAQAEGSAWHGPGAGGSGHVYLAKAILPPPRGLAQLRAMDAAIERTEWTAAERAFSPIAHGPRAE